MEEAARRRQERLAALRAGAPIAEVEPPHTDVVQELVYADRPEEAAQGGRSDAAVSASIFAGDKTLEAQVAFLLSEARSLPSTTDFGRQGEVTLEELAPRKANWDLKQDYSRRTEALQKQYERACTELIHERLAKDAEP